MHQQKILRPENNYRELDGYFLDHGLRRPMLVCGKSIEKLPLWDYFLTLEQRLGVKAELFRDFTPNPAYESAVRGVGVFRRAGCDSVVAVGGGSAMDTAKCIKLWARTEGGGDFTERPAVHNDIPLVAVPTTAGTGSEATRYAIIYHKGEKLSVTHEDCIPSAVVLDPALLDTLPPYQRKATMLDALCHAVESYWSVNSDDESKGYAARAARMVFENLGAYMANTPEGNAGMLAASNLAGKAINITQTTAGHAMSYKLTGLYNLAHGHAAALCVCALWPYMLSHTSLCADARGEEYLKSMFSDLAGVMGCGTPEDAAGKFRATVDSLSLERPKAGEGDFETLKISVNPGRLKNNPVSLTEDAIDSLYREILGRR